MFAPRGAPCDSWDRDLLAGLTASAVLGGLDLRGGLDLLAVQRHTLAAPGVERDHPQLSTLYRSIVWCETGSRMVR